MKLLNHYITTEITVSTQAGRRKRQTDGSSRPSGTEQSELRTVFNVNMSVSVRDLWYAVITVMFPVNILSKQLWLSASDVSQTAAVK